MDYDGDQRLRSRCEEEEIVQLWGDADANGRFDPLGIEVPQQLGAMVFDGSRRN